MNKSGVELALNFERQHSSARNIVNLTKKQSGFKSTKSFLLRQSFDF